MGTETKARESITYLARILPPLGCIFASPLGSGLRTTDCWQLHSLIQG